MAIDLGYDEGGSGDSLIVSAQAGITIQAKKLKRKWRERMPESLPYFHSKDFAVYNGGVFTKAKLNRPARQRLVDDLSTFIHQHLFAAVTATISVKEYESLTSQEFRSRHGTAYGFAANACLLTIYQLVVDAGFKAEFNVLIEKGHRNSAQVVQILEGLQRIPAEVQAAMGGNTIPDLRILSVGLGEKGDHPILQAADMVAYAEWQGLTNGDRTIWDAIDRKHGKSSYSTWRVPCDRGAIELFAMLGAKSLIRKQKKRGKSHVINDRKRDV